jgi:hypothetical protein
VEETLQQLSNVITETILVKLLFINDVAHLSKIKLCPYLSQKHNGVNYIVDNAALVSIFKY